ncbi:MAG TPA: peptidase S1 [Magnetospirillum sp.]|nr:peptidase S1 [Magnetospirillum sp.]
MARQGWRAAAVTAAAILAAPVPGGAVTALDGTWRAEGGGKGHEADGFGAHLRLAAEPQFRAVLALSTDGKTWGEASATWIGNDATHAYVLTAAHIYELPAKVNAYVVRGPDGTVWRPDRLWVHPQWNGDTETRTGYDAAILRLPKPLEGMGAPPVLYGGQGEEGKLITFVGFGSRGIGSTGEADRFYTGSAKAAAQGVVDQWVGLAPGRKSKGDVGNYLGVFFPKEDGSIANPYGGARKPATSLVGLLGSGDSGGSAWMPLKGGWVLVGINSNGDGTARYGDSSWFARVSALRPWITEVFPGAHFSD